jgi:hypothetical protein
MPATTFLDSFGLNAGEILAGRDAARRSIDSPLVQLSRRVLEEASPKTCEAIRSSLVAPWLSAYSEAGQAMFVLMARDQPEAIATWDGVLHNLLADPVSLRDIAIWCLFFATLEGAAAFQLDECPSPSEEGHLSGLLLGALKGRCEQWRRTASAPLERSGSSLSVQRIDLSILGGEQVTGGDFGLVLDFDRRSSQPIHSADGPGGRIVPLVFQAKRYIRPTADVSRHHHVRGYQYDLLRQNECASAYIFYENGREPIERPIPPMVKPVGKVGGPSRTSVFTDSYDLPSYLLNALTDDRFAAGAASADEALRMIYAKAHPKQIAYLAVISSDARAGDRYAGSLADLASALREQDDETATEDETN